MRRCSSDLFASRSLSWRVHFGTPFWGMGGCRPNVGSQRLYAAPFERAMIVSYRLSIVTIPNCYLLCLWPFGRNLSSNVTNAQINKEWVTLGQNLWRKRLTDVGLRAKF